MGGAYKREAKMSKMFKLANNKLKRLKMMNNSETSNGQCWRIAVIGGGAGALSFCLQLFNKLANAKLQVETLEIVVLEKSAAIGPGLAYGKHLEENLADSNILNIPKDGMSLVLNEFGHFSGWLEERAKEQKENDSAKMDDYKDKQFPPRHVFGEYLMAQAEKLAKTSEKHPKIKINFLTNKIVDEIQPIKTGKNGDEGQGAEIFKIKYSSALKNGNDFEHQSTLLANQVVLCVGHMPSHTYRQFVGIPGYGHDAASTAEQFDRMDEMDPVIILGTRLSAIDLVLALQNKKHRGPIWICSRNGLLPAAYKPLNAVAVQMEGDERESAFKLVTKSWLELGEAKMNGNHRTLALKYVHGSSIQNDTIYCLENVPAKNGNCKKCCCYQNALIGIKLGHETLPMGKENAKEDLAGDLDNNEVDKSFGMRNFDEFAAEEKFTVKELLERFFAQLPEFDGPKMTLEKVIERNKQMSPLEWFEEQAQNSHPLAPVKPWQLFMTALQPMVPALWSALDLEEKAKFWEAVHGLYMCYYPSCPHVNAKRMRDMFLGKQLRLIRHLGEVKFDEEQKMFVVEGEENGMTVENDKNEGNGRQIEIRAKHLFNATGPGMVAAHIPVIEKLLRNGQAKQHPFGGIYVDERTMRVLGVAEDGDGKNLTAHQNMFAIGDLTSGHFYKTACLGMVAEQADIVAEQIAHLFKQN